jgi:hypothetical protein
MFGAQLWASILTTAAFCEARSRSSLCGAMFTFVHIKVICESRRKKSRRVRHLLLRFFLIANLLNPPHYNLTVTTHLNNASARRKHHVATYSPERTEKTQTCFRSQRAPRARGHIFVSDPTAPLPTGHFTLSSLRHTEVCIFTVSFRPTPRRNAAAARRRSRAGAELGCEAPVEGVGMSRRAGDRGARGAVVMSARR